MSNTALQLKSQLNVAAIHVYLVTQLHAVPVLVDTFVEYGTKEQLRAQDTMLVVAINDVLGLHGQILLTDIDPGTELLTNEQLSVQVLLPVVQM